MLQPAPGLASYTLGQKTTISERYAQIFQAPVYIVRVVTVRDHQRILIVTCPHSPFFYSFGTPSCCPTLQPPHPNILDYRQIGPLWYQSGFFPGVHPTPTTPRRRWVDRDPECQTLQTSQTLLSSVSKGGHAPFFVHTQIRYL